MPERGARGALPQIQEISGFALSGANAPPNFLLQKLQPVVEVAVSRPYYRDAATALFDDAAAFGKLMSPEMSLYLLWHAMQVALMPSSARCIGSS